MDGKKRTVLFTLAILGSMSALVVASVPLYRVFCRVTGYAGTPRSGSEVSDSLGSPRGSGEGHIVVRFDTNVMPDMPWRFAPERTSMSVRLGERTLAFFTAENTSNQPLVGTAVFNVTPLKAATYVNKIQCFCFTQQRLGPNEKAEMPVTFFIDPKIADDPNTAEVGTITLSYTFYKSRDQSFSANLPAGRVQSTSAGAIERGDNRL
jgi:cytochrome c oxidase assembly protein subunit 11